ncbi:MAG: tyrosine-protein phosphatase [Pauljensenia sp.]
MLDGFVNLRDVGGLRTEDGGVVRRGALLRSDFPTTLPPSSRDVLADLPLTRVVDLRDRDEVDSSPTLFPSAGFEVHCVPIFTGSAQSFVEAGTGLAALYTHLLDDCGATLARAVASISRAPEGAVLVHCTVGKDRTGVVVALALAAVGVRSADVIGDYSRTEGNLRGRWLEHRIDVLSALHGRDLSGIADLLGSSPPSLIGGALVRVAERWGSPARYLLEHGLEQEDLLALRRRLLHGEE